MTTKELKKQQNLINPDDADYKKIMLDFGEYFKEQYAQAHYDAMYIEECIADTENAEVREKYGVFKYCTAENLHLMQGKLQAYEDILNYFMQTYAESSGEINDMFYDIRHDAWSRAHNEYKALIERIKEDLSKNAWLYNFGREINNGAGGKIE